MKLTREEAIERTRDMWNWIANKTLEREIIVTKWSYFIENGIDIDDIPVSECYLCEYSEQYGVYDAKCKYCPLKFTSETKSFGCLNDDSPFNKWDEVRFACGDYELAAKYAREIANLPEK